MVIAVAAIVVIALLPALFGPKSGAPWLPKSPPQESNRITHPQGFSIIPPPDWVVRIRNSDSDLEGFAIAMSPGSGLRYAPSLSAKLSESTPNLSEFHEVNFSGMKAYERTIPAGDAERPCLLYELIVLHNSRWYEVDYFTQRFRDKCLEIPEAMMLYIRSFKPSP
jgi:hypothetical protein